jgi:hypothetical protein
MATARMPQPTAEDPVKVDPRHYKVEFENERVRVLRIKYGRKIGHTQPPRSHCRVPDRHQSQVHLPRRADGRHQGECRDGASHGRLYPPAGKPQQDAIRGHRRRVKTLGSICSIRERALLPLSFCPVRYANSKQRSETTPHPLPPDQDQRHRQEVRENNLDSGLVRAGRRKALSAARARLRHGCDFCLTIVRVKA